MPTFLCDGVNHCQNGEDETHPRCHKNSGENMYSPATDFSTIVGQFNFFKLQKERITD